MKPEERARLTIDALLEQAGWVVCNMADANIHGAQGVAIREVEAEVEENLSRATALRAAILARAFCAGETYGVSD